MRPEWEKLNRSFFGERKLNLGCANNHEPGWLNLDLNPAVHPDVVHDLESLPLPFLDASFDTVLGSHVFEHIRNFVPLVEDIYRILAPGGYLIGITPYGSSDNAWDNPHHVRCFTETTWQYFDQELYKGDHAGNGATEGYKGDLKLIQVILVPTPEFLNDPELEFKRRHWRNIIQEVQAVLRKGI